MRRRSPAVRRSGYGLLPRDRVLRQVALASLLNNVGTGLFLSAGAIFLVRSAGLTPGEAGAGLTVGALIGFGAGPLLGDLADRCGSRGVLIVCTLVEAVGSCLLLLVDDVASLTLAAAVGAVGRSGAISSRGALIGVLAPPGEGARLRTYLRAVTNVGLALGTMGAAIVLAVDTRAAYLALIVGDTATFVLTAAILGFVPRQPPTRAVGDEPRPEGRWLALRDSRYLALTATTAVASLQYYVLIYALPLWVTLETDAPRWLAAALFLLAAVVVAAIQVPATRSIRDTRSASRLITWSGPLFIASWGCIALASLPAAVSASVLLVVGLLLHALGEVWQAAGTFELSFALADDEAHGQYQGVMGLGHSLAEAVAPALVIGACVSWGGAGWLTMAVVVAVAGAAAGAVDRLPRRVDGDRHRAH